MVTWIENGNRAGWMYGKKLSLDEPCATVMAGGMGGDSITHWYIVSDGKEDNVKPDASKPPYRVPLMTEIAAIPKNGLKVVSTFSGAGGSCLGFKMAGFEVAWANEFVPAAQEVYRLNHPETHLDTRDIRRITPEDVLAVCPVVDVLEGSPPCSSFSTAGKQDKKWGKIDKYSDTKQRTDDLFWEYARLLRGIQPRAFVAENVSGLVKGVSKGYFKEILRMLRGCGYVVEARLLDASWLGVPQKRQRVFFVGMREDLGLTPTFPSPLPYRYSLRDALPWIATMQNRKHGWFTPGGMVDVDDAAPTVLTGDSGGAYYGHIVGVEARVGNHERVWQSADEPSPCINAGLQGNEGHVLVRCETGERIDLEGTTIGEEWEQMHPGEAIAHARKRRGEDDPDKYFNLIRPNPDEPCATVSALGGVRGAAAVTHPLEKRKFTIAELKRICAFPDDFILTGSYAQQWERLGRSVPPLMMHRVAVEIGRVLMG